MLPSGRFPRIALGLGIVVAVFLLLDLTQIPDQQTRLLGSNSLDFAMVSLATVCAFYAARRASGYGRQLWTLLGVALALESTAQGITTYYQSFVPDYSQIPLPSDILFFVWAAPVVMMFLPSADKRDEVWDWLRIADFAQIAIVAVTAYCYFFYVPSHWLTDGADFPAEILELLFVRDALLAASFLFRSRSSRCAGVRSFSTGLFIVFLLAAMCDGYYFATLRSAEATARWGDFFWIFPYFVVVLLAVKSKWTEADFDAGATSRAGDFALTHVVPVCIPLLVIVMGRRIAEEQVVIAWVAVAASFLCSALRLILTNRKQRRISDELLATEKALRRSEQVFASAFRASPDAFSIAIFPDGAYLDVNEGFTRLTGYAREEVLGKTPREMNMWQDFSRRDEFLAELTKRGEFRDMEFRFRTKTGEGRTGLVAGALLDLDGRRCVMLMVRDITDRKAAEELLRSSEERFRSLLEHLQVGIASFDPQSRLQFANQAAQDMFGVRLKEIMGRTAREIGLLPLREDGTPLPDSGRPLARVIETGEAIRSQVFGWRRSHTDEILWTLIDAVPEFDAANNLVRVLVSLTNVTEQRKVMEALRESEERFRTLVRDLHVAVVLINPEGNVEFANRASLEIFGVTEAQVLQKHIVNLGFIPVNESGRRITYEDLPDPYVLRTKEPVLEGTMGWQRPGESEICWIFGNAVPQLSSDGSVLRVILSFTDITAIKNAERSIHHLSTRLLKLQDEERRRIGRELHDGLAQTVLAVNLNLVQVRQLVSPLEGNAERAMDQARELLKQMSREIRTLSYLLHPPLLDDLGLVSALKEYVHGFSERSGIQTALAPQTTFPRLPQAVETAFFRIVQECLGNIQKHSGSQSATVTLGYDDTVVSLEIADSGRGMVVPSNGNNGPGEARLGVGITGMRERMSQLGGRLEIKSGSTGTTVRATMLRTAAILREAQDDVPLYPDRG